MTISWEHSFRRRMRGFEAHRPPQPGEVAISLKVRVVAGCFHREHSPHAYEVIDQKLLAIPVADREFDFEEHESGPEILVYLAAVTAGITLAKSVIDLLTTIIKARAESVKKGDRPSEPIELIIRRVEGGSEFREETIIRIGHNDAVDPREIERRLKDATAKLLRNTKDGGSSQSAAPDAEERGR